MLLGLGSPCELLPQVEQAVHGGRQGYEPPAHCPAHLAHTRVRERWFSSFLVVELCMGSSTHIKSAISVVLVTHLIRAVHIQYPRILVVKYFILVCAKYTYIFIYYKSNSLDKGFIFATSFKMD